MPTVTAVLPTDPDRTFDALTDVAALPAWHERTVAVPERPAGCRVSVTWRLAPRTCWRQRVGVPVRSAMLDREVAPSLTAVEHHVMTATRAAVR